MLQITEIEIDIVPTDKVKITAFTADNICLVAEADWLDIRKADRHRTKECKFFERWYAYNHKDKAYITDLFLNLPVGCMSIVPE